MVSKYKTVPLETPNIKTRAPSGDVVTEDDVCLLPVYAKLLHRVEAGDDWCSISATLLDIDPDKDLDSAQSRYQSYLARAQWMTEVGYRQLTDKTDPNSMFLDWLLAIFINLIKSGDIIPDPSCADVDLWAKETAKALVEAGDIEPDPHMSSGQCAEKLILLLGTRC